MVDKDHLQYIIYIICDMINVHVPLAPDMFSQAGFIAT